MPPPPPTEGTAPLERLAHLRDTYGTLPRAQRELVIFGLALLCGLIDAVSHLVRRQPRARAVYPRPECTRRPVRPAGGFLPGAGPRVGGVLGRRARAGGAAAADPPVRRPGAGAAGVRR